MGSVFIAGRFINEKMCHICQNFFSIRGDSLEKQGNIEHTLNDLIQKICTFTLGFDTIIISIQSIYELIHKHM